MDVGRIVLVAMVALAMSAGGAKGTEYTVGDSFGWGVPPTTKFYSDWAANKTFQADDFFAFKWNGTHTATMTTPENYDSCNTTGGQSLVDSGVSVRFNKNGTYYYICTIDNHCQRGQKIKFVIGDGIFDSSASAGTAASLAVVVLSLLVVYFMGF